MKGQKFQQISGILQKFRWILQKFQTKFFVFVLTFFGWTKFSWKRLNKNLETLVTLWFAHKTGKVEEKKISTNRKLKVCTNLQCKKIAKVV